MAKGNKFTGGGINQNKAGMMQRVQQMQEEMERIQNEVSEQTVEATAGGGAVTVVIAGTKEIKKIDIAEELVDPDDIETLTDTLVAGINEAIKKVEDTNKKEMEKITGNINMPGLF